MISKELLSAVLGDTVYEIQLLESNAIFGGVQLWVSSDEYDMAVNIYELAHKCKEWAFNQGCVLHTYSRPTVFNCVCKINHGKEYEVNTFILDSEPEAIFKACQWILTEKDKQ